MTSLPRNIGQFEFTVLASQRVAQLMRGCVARCPRDGHKATTVARLEVASGHVARAIGVGGSLPTAASAPAEVL